MFAVKENELTHPVETDLSLRVLHCHRRCIRRTFFKGIASEQNFYKRVTRA
jgi:hypothetical protein